MAQHTTTGNGARRGMWRTRWAAVGAAVAVVAGAGGIGFANAAGEQPVSVAVAPCRLFDTRPGADNVGAKNTPLGEGDANVMTVQVTGPSGRCNLPLEATSVRLNLTVVSPTANSFLTLFPADGTRPGSSALNWSAGQAPTSNYAETTLSADGKIKLFNRFGSVQVLADVTGYTTGHAPNQLDNNQLAREQWEKDPRKDLTTTIASLGPPAFDGRSVWVTEEGGSDVLQVQRIDPSTGARVGAPVRLFSEPSGDKLYSTVSTFDGRSLWFGVDVFRVALGNTSGFLVEFDTLTRSVVRTLEVGSKPTALAFDGTNVWVGNSFGLVRRVNAASGTLLTPDLNFGTRTTDLLFDGSKMWVNGDQTGASPSGTVFCVDPVAPVAVARLNSGTGGQLAFDGSRVWTTNNEQLVRLYNAGTCSSITTVTPSSTARDMAFDGTRMWVRNGTGLIQINANSLAVTTSANVTLSATDLLFDGTAVWSSSPLRRHRVG